MAQLVLLALESTRVAKYAMTNISNRDGGGLSMVSWYVYRIAYFNQRADPGMFQRTLHNIKKAKKVMGAPRRPYQERRSN
jgi:hypothetical protein